MTTSKSPRTVLLVAHAIGTDALPQFAHRFSPRKFTLPQLFACLALKEAMRLDYRGVAALLADCPDLRAAIGLPAAPHFTTLHKAAARLLAAAPARRLLDAAVARCRATPRHPNSRRRVLPARVAVAAVDASGFESRHVSAYFLKRMGCHRWDGHLHRRYAKHPKLAVACDAATHVVLACDAGRGPAPDDPHYRRVLADAVRRARVRAVVADAGYDAEASHAYARGMGVRSVIPPTRGRPSPTGQPPSGRWRRLMHRAFPAALYRRRYQCETVFSMIKRRQGAALSARSAHAQNRQLRLRVLAHNTMLLASVWR